MGMVDDYSVDGPASDSGIDQLPSKVVEKVRFAKGPAKGRRSFLRAVVVAAGAAGLAGLHSASERPTETLLGLAELGFPTEAYLSLMINRLLEEAKQEASKVGVELPPNQYKRPLMDIINGGIKEYEQNGGVVMRPAVVIGDIDPWQPDKYYFDAIRAEMGLVENIDKELKANPLELITGGNQKLRHFGSDLINVVYASAPEEARLALTSGINVLEGYVSVGAPGSGILRRLQSKLDAGDANLRFKFIDFWKSLYNY